MKYLRALSSSRAKPRSFTSRSDSSPPCTSSNTRQTWLLLASTYSRMINHTKNGFLSLQLLSHSLIVCLLLVKAFHRHASPSLYLQHSVSFRNFLLQEYLPARSCQLSSCGRKRETSCRGRKLFGEKRSSLGVEGPLEAIRILISCN